MNFEEKTIKQEYVFRGKVITLRFDNIKLPDGNDATREVIEHNGGVCVVVINEDFDTLLVRQYRYPFKSTTLEIPAGKKNLGEDDLVCGLRELTEETGAAADSLIDLGEMLPSPGYCAEKIRIYLALNPKMGESHPDEDEFVEVVKMPFEKAVKMAYSGEINDAKTVIGILRAEKYLENIKK